MDSEKNLIGDFRSDVSAGLAVFLVSVPLCLGVALASGSPMLSGLIAGIVGGLICGLLSKSNVAVSGPAAGLAAVCLHSITQLGSFSLFLVAVVLAGFMQIGLGLVKAGSLARLFPASARGHKR